MSTPRKWKAQRARSWGPFTSSVTSAGRRAQQQQGWAQWPPAPLPSFCNQNSNTSYLKDQVFITDFHMEDRVCLCTLVPTNYMQVAARIHVQVLKVELQVRCGQLLPFHGWEQFEALCLYRSNVPTVVNRSFPLCWNIQVANLLYAVWAHWETGSRSQSVCVFPLPC